jgi:hypothetical protein
MPKQEAGDDGEKPKRRQRPLVAAGRERPVDEPPPPPIERPLPTYAEALPPPPPSDSVVVSFEGPGRQRRVTVAFRVFLAIPHFLWATVLGIVAYFAVIAGWFAALVLGRLPHGIAAFVGRVIQYYARVHAYGALLLTDRYPPFALSATDYAVSVELRPTRLNRAAVLFRLILLIPAAIVQSIVSAGQQVAAIVIWLIVLIVGRLPAPVFEAEAALLRYLVRFWAYAAMMTGEYPGGLLGDPPAAATEAPPALPARPRITRLVVSKAGRRIVVLFIVLGALFGVGTTATSAINASRTATAFDKLNDRHNELGAAFQSFNADAQTCAVSGGLDCLHSADNRLADAVERFGRQLATINFPASVGAGVSRLHRDVQDLAGVLRRLGRINAESDYRAEVVEFQRLANTFDEDYQAVAFAF